MYIPVPVEVFFFEFLKCFNFVYTNHAGCIRKHGKWNFTLTLENSIIIIIFIVSQILFGSKNIESIELYRYT